MLLCSAIAESSSAINWFIKSDLQVVLLSVCGVRCPNSSEERSLLNVVVDKKTKNLNWLHTNSYEILFKHLYKGFFLNLIRGKMLFSPSTCVLT